MPRPKWRPTPEQVSEVAVLAELGWTHVQIASVLGLELIEFANALVYDADLKQAYETALENRKSPDKRLTWVPRPQDLKVVEDLAAEGHSVKAIASKMGISATVLDRRLVDTPMLRDAFETGEGRYQADLQEQYLGLRKKNSEDLKYVASSLIFELKARCGLNDKAPVQAVTPVQVSVDHKHSFEVPKKIPIDEFAAQAAIEMDRAKRESVGKVKIPDVIDVEVS